MYDLPCETCKLVCIRYILPARITRRKTARVSCDVGVDCHCPFRNRPKYRSSLQLAHNFDDASISCSSVRESVRVVAGKHEKEGYGGDGEEENLERASRK